MGILSLSTLIETNYIKRLLKDNKKTPQDIKMSAPNSNNNQASMIGGHAQYAKGYVEESETSLDQKNGKKVARRMPKLGSERRRQRTKIAHPSQQPAELGAESRSW